ncbi:hypothetical protein [Nocardia yamanashiensis]|uniref:hypothetical protein n=1 Tax=Nocardia yamanashiensis TaxID=209247 RepID=UPI00082BE8C5|nr:hypothetical protein [Nocardia yamanashiensis]
MMLREETCAGGRYAPDFAPGGAADRIARQRGVIGDASTIADAHRVFVERIAAADAKYGADCGYREALRHALATGGIAPASQLLAALGGQGTAASCTVLPVAGPTDADRLARAVVLIEAGSRRGLGCGVDLSDFDDPARGARLINAATARLNRELRARRSRPPALMLTCDSRHPRSVEFATVKSGADFGDWVANISLRVSGGDLEWERLRPVLAAAAHANGEPGVLFQRAAEADNPTPEYEIRSTAPCAEVFLAEGERCVFVSINLAAHVGEDDYDWLKLKHSIALCLRTADNAVDIAAHDAEDVVLAKRRVGVGFCGFHTSLLMLGIPYSRSVRTARRLAEFLTYGCHRESQRLAAERGPFPAFHTSRWTDRAWVGRKRALRAGAVRPADWRELEECIVRHGIRNASAVAFPPTGVVAEMLGVSRSYEPHFSLLGQTGVASRFENTVPPEVRRHGIGVESLDSAGQLPGIGESHLLACARQLTPDTHLRIHAAFSGFADDAASKTINLPAEATVDDVAALFDRARSLGLKGLSVFRDGCLGENGDER